MESLSSSMEQQLAKVFFVLRTGHNTEADASEDMQTAYSNVRDHDEKLAEWITEAECLKLEEANQTKMHVFVFEKFSGAAFERVRKAPSTVIGPRCLNSCFMTLEPIPLGVHPVYTTAMRNLTVCSSGLKAKEKAAISQLVFYMGGYYLDVLNAACTHLVSSTVKSVKYEKAAQINLPIMHPDWVQRVWEESQRHQVHATDVCFLERHRLPVFHSLTITSTGLPAAKKNEVKSLVEANGGVYAGAFKSEVTDILILEKSSIGTAKFQGAVRSKKECLSPEWIVDSVACGYALPIHKYEVKSLKASTPTKDTGGGGTGLTADEPGTRPGDRVSGGDFNPDCTQLSEISHANFSARNVTINESLMSSAGSVESVPIGGPSVLRPSARRHREILSRMTVQQAKKAGSVLDGCNVFLSGFTGEEKEKLNKILNAVGAVRYDEISPTVSHVIVGEQIVSELGLLRDSTAHLLTLEWLAKSIELRQLAPEEAAEYAFRASGKGIAERAPEPPSPSSKKNLQRMNNSVFKRPEVPKLRLDGDVGGSSTVTANVVPDARPSQEDSIMLQYMEKNLAERLPQTTAPTEPAPAPAPASTSTTSMATTTTSQPDSELESQFTEFMLGKTLFVFGFCDEDAVQIINDVRSCGGTIVDETYSDEVDYIVLPTSSIGRPDFQVTGRETVNCIWLEASVSDGQCYPMEYYFAPIPYDEDDPRPLEGETIVISSYSGPERNFLIAMGGMLGAEVHERLVRKDSPLLVCKEPNGAKYNAAIQWGLTVVRAEWLRECARTKRRVPEGPFLVGDSTCSAKNTATGGANACLPTTSTDEVDIESVREEPKKMDDDESTIRPPQASSTMKPRPNPTGLGEYRYITEQKTREQTDLQYGFRHLSTPELRKMNGDERMIYSQELDQYEELIVAQRTARKPFNPDEGAAPAISVTGAMDSPTIPRNRRLSALTAGGSSSSRSPATPGASLAAFSKSATNGTPPAGGGEYEAQSVTLRVAEFDTPVRETLYRVLKDEEEKERNVSPRTRRMKELLATPHGASGAPAGHHVRTPTLPECMTNPVTPYGFRPDASPENHAFHKRKLQHWDRFHKQGTVASGGDGGETASQKERRLSTPLSEIKRRFWRENLGDEYVDYMESKYTSQSSSNVRALNRSTERGDEEDVVAGTQQSPKHPSPGGFVREISGKEAAPSGATATVVAASSRRSPLQRGNISAEKRTRRERDEEGDEENEYDRSDGSIAAGRERTADDSSALGGGQLDEEEQDERPVAKKPLLSVDEDEYVKRLSDVIAAARESAKKKAKTMPPPVQQEFTELREPYDSELNAGVGGVIWRDRDIVNVPTNKTPRPDVEGNSAKKRIFAITGVQEDERLALAQKIEQLQGRVASDPIRYDPVCTHIVCAKPNRGEKMLSGMASGKWILSIKYIEDSYGAGRFLDEENYEWGNPKAAETLASLATPSELEAAATAPTWRQRIATDVSKQDGAFTGFRVLLVGPRKEQFMRLVQSGGGYVIDCDPPFIHSELAMTATHCFVDRKVKLATEDHRALAEAGVAVLSIMYLNAYLTSPELPDPNSFQLPL